jgi:xanthine dehydrogenase accessory factor
MSAESVIDAAMSWLRAGRRVALATVIDTWNSSPRPVGSQMAIDDRGLFEGSVSGGCVETAIIDASAALLAGGPPKSFEYGVTNERAWEVGLPCGGKVEVFLQAADLSALEAIADARARRSTYGVETELRTGRATVFGEDRVPPHLSATWRELRLGPDDEATALVELKGGRSFVQLVRPPMQMVIVGAVHLTQVLAPLAKLAGFQVTIVDPRAAFANDDRFKDVELVVEWPDKALASRPLGRRSALITLSHDAKLDEPALTAALKSECFYIGALGSKKTQASRRARLLEAGFSEANLSRIHGPVGLAIGAKTTAEIAISIMGQVIEHRRKPT